MINFDHNATTPLCTAAREAWLDAVERFPGNPSSPHRLGARAERALDEARQQAARLLECSPLDLVWTSGATEANNAIFHHASLGGEGEVWLSAIEHPSILRAAEHGFPGRVRHIPVTSAGIIELTWLAERLKSQRPCLVAIMAANNETGVIQPWSDALQLCRERGVVFACDAAQWVGKLPSASLGQVDFVSGCAHKFGGPLGVGFLKVRGGFRGLLHGGEQEEGRRAGTQNTPGVLAMLAAWSHRESQLAGGETQTRETWRDDFVRKALDFLPGAALLGQHAPRLWNTASLLMPPAADDRRRWVVALDKLGFAVSTGSACASGKQKISHVVKAMGYTEGDRMLRFSAGWETSEEDWHKLVEAVRAASARLGYACRFSSAASGMGVESR